MAVKQALLSRLIPKEEMLNQIFQLQGNITILSWKLPNLNPGDKWGIWYQQKVQGAGYVPLMLDTSNITFNDLFGTFINITINSPPGVSIGGGGLDVSYLALGDMQLIANPPVVFTNENSTITVTAKYEDGNPAIASTTLFSDLGYFNDLQNPLNNLTVSGLQLHKFQKQHRRPGTNICS